MESHESVGEKLMTIPEVADYLDVAVRTIYQWRYQRLGPPGCKIGGQVRYRRSDVECWVDRQIAAERRSA